MKRQVSSRMGVLAATGVVVTAVCATVAFAASGGSSAQAAGGAQMSLAGGASFAVKSYEFEIEADSTWTKGAGASVGKPQPGKFIFTKPVDPTIDALITNIASGQSFSKAELTVSWGTGERLTYLMTNLFVTKVQEIGESGRPVDRIELVYKTLEWKLGSASGSWDISAGKVK